MIILIKIILQAVIIISFAGLSFIGLLQKDLNIGFTMNLILVLLYIVIYWSPIK